MQGNIILAVVIFIILIFVLPSLFKEILSRKLTNYLISGDYESFDNLINHKISNIAFDPFNIDYMKLNKALILKDKDEIDNIFDRFDNCRLTNNQKLNVYYNGFYHYVSLNNVEKAKKYGNLLLKLPNSSENLKKEIKKYYKIIIDKSYEYLEEELLKLEELNYDQRAKSEFLISKMYENKGDIENAKKYLELSIKHLK